VFRKCSYLLPFAVTKNLKSRLNSANAFYHSFQNVLSSCLLSKNLNIQLHKTMLLPVVLCAVKVDLLHLGRTQTEGVWEQVLRRILGPKREEVVGGWRRLHNEELHNLYASPNIIRVIKSKRMRWLGHVACMRQTRNAYNVLVEKTWREETTRKSRRRWEDNIKMDPGEMRILEWIHLVQNRDQWQVLVNTVLSLLFHTKRIISWQSEWLSAY